MIGPLARVDVVCPRCGSPADADMFIDDMRKMPGEISFRVRLLILDPDDCATGGEET